MSSVLKKPMDNYYDTGILIKSNLSLYLRANRTF